MKIKIKQGTVKRYTSTTSRSDVSKLTVYVIRVVRQTRFPTYVPYRPSHDLNYSKPHQIETMDYEIRLQHVEIESLFWQSKVVLCGRLYAVYHFIKLLFFTISEIEMDWSRGIVCVFRSNNNLFYFVWDCAVSIKESTD